MSEKEFEVEIGIIFDDNNRDITIIDKIRAKDSSGCSRKHYKYHCNKCGYEGLMLESNLLVVKNNCSCCENKVVSIGINDIPTTAPWMIPYFQGGYDEAILYTKCSGKKIIPICPKCRRIKSKSMKISDLYNRHTISCSCLDNIPYGEKLMFNVLEQLEIDFATQLNKTTLDWCDKYRYDFFIHLFNIVIETHGIQHYKESFGNIKSNKKIKTIEEEIENDRIKKELALANGIKEENYIVIDCRKSELEFIKQNILKSKLSELFDLSIVDWNKVQEFALSNRVKEACDLWNSGFESTYDISKIMKISTTTIRKYLNKGTELNWCFYQGKEVARKAHIKSGKEKGNSIVCINNGINFSSISELEKNSEKTFKIKLDRHFVSKACKDGLPYRGFHFKYISDLTPEELIKYKIINEAS